MNSYSFKDILKDEIPIEKDKDGKEVKILLDRIEIPKIQRDYAQGRKNEKETEVRKRFLDHIFKILNSPGQEISEMDFVYGSVLRYTRDEKEEKVFTPLDGQQRLTTLFLLYWYIGTRELEQTKREELYMLLNKFTYETRTSSREFCKELTTQKTITTFEKKPSKIITNLPWFYKSYNQDPTIKSMLNMLDDINDKYGNDNQQLFNKLQNLQFYILSLTGFNLTDELYVKMNARGKQLTDFENFKADLTKWMKDEENTEKEFFHKKVKLDDREMLYYLSFCQKIDTTWTKFFWEETKHYDIDKKDDKGKQKYPEGKIVDPLFLRLFFRYFFCKLILESNQENTKLVENQYYNFFYNEEKYQNFDSFKEVVSRNHITNFEELMDVLSKNREDIISVIQPSWQKYPKNEFVFWNEGITQSQRVILIGIILHLENQVFDKSKFKQWMRVVWNIVENTDINSHVTMISAIKLIADLYKSSANSENIYKFLANDKTEPPSSKNAVLEERKKAKFIVDCLWEDEVFINAEKHPFFKGSVDFIMSNEMTKEDFVHRTKMATSVFIHNGINHVFGKEKGHIFLRALISRYKNFEQIDNKNFTDTDENEHFFKKMLASDTIVKNATREWFSLPDEENLLIKLENEVSKLSEMNGEDQRAKKIHESLYKSSDLQKWMQEGEINKKRIRLSYRWGKRYIHRPYSKYDWVMIDGYQNEIINRLLDLYECQTDQQCKLSDGTKIPFFQGNDKVKLRRIIQNYKFEYVFDRNYVYVGLYETDEYKTKFSDIEFQYESENNFGESSQGWICRKKYDYQNEVNLEEQIHGFIEKIENEVFNLSNPDSLIAKLSQYD